MAADSTSVGEKPAAPANEDPGTAPISRWGQWFRRAPRKGKEKANPANNSSDEEDNTMPKPEKWSMGILNDTETDEVPGSILLMSNTFKRNEPLGLRNAPARTSASSLPSPYLAPEETSSIRRSVTEPRTPPPAKRPHSARSPRPGLMRMLSGLSEKSAVEEKKMTKDGKIILEPQPEESLNDPLNWPAWRRDVALISLGFYCAMGGGMTPALAAAFNDVSATYHIPVAQVSLTTGFYMLGLGFGSVIASPTAILIGKRPVYIAGAVLFIISSIWCALSPTYPSLIVARIFMGLSVSPVECLPSATIAEIFYLHERAYRLGIYTLLLLGGKNLIPLVTAIIDGALGWRWIFWIIAITAGLAVVLVFFFVPETFWDRTPRAKKHVRKHRLGSFSHLFRHDHGHGKAPHSSKELSKPQAQPTLPPGNINLADVATEGTIAQRRQKTMHHVGFADAEDTTQVPPAPRTAPVRAADVGFAAPETASQEAPNHGEQTEEPQSGSTQATRVPESDANEPVTKEDGTPAPKIEDHNLPYFMSRGDDANVRDVESTMPHHDHDVHTPSGHASGTSTPTGSSLNHAYTQQLRYAPPKTYLDTLKLWHGVLRRESWFKAAARPFVLYAYPSILWSTLVYSLSIGWLIVLSESVSVIYRNKETYNFTATQTGLVYLSPFIGGVLGTAVAGKLSDVIVRYMARRNNGIYEPEFRLVMAIPILISTAIGLMGFGWSAQERDNFMVPTFFFGVISFGCSLGSTTAITFAVDSYRQYAGEALVTLNFSKNVFHGFVFSLFFTNWLEKDGGKNVFAAIGGIHIACLLSSLPMYIYGKRARMWTVRKNMMERF